MAATVSRSTCFSSDEIAGGNHRKGNESNELQQSGGLRRRRHSQPTLIDEIAEKTQTLSAVVKVLRFQIAQKHIAPACNLLEMLDRDMTCAVMNCIRRFFRRIYPHHCHIRASSF
jgi:hypothetical protein